MDDDAFKLFTKQLQNATPDQKKVFREALSEKASEEAPGTQAVAVPAPAKKRHDELSDLLIAAAERKLDGNDPRQRAGTFLFNPITNQLKRSPTSGGGSASYDLSGNPKETGPGSPDDLRTDRLPRMKEESAEAAAEQERRQGIRDSVALPISYNINSGSKGRDTFKDYQGRIEDPATLKARLTKEGWNLNDATIAAEQRSRDMYAAPNAKNDGLGNAQRGAVLGADPGLRPDGTSPRMDVMQQLKNARADNLQAETKARLNNPFRKSVGITTKIEHPDGTVLAQRGEGEVRTDRAGNTVDAPGRMNYLNGAANLKDALSIYDNFDTAKRPNVPVFYEGTNEPSMTGDGASRRQETAPAPAPTVTKTNEGVNGWNPETKRFEGGLAVRGVYGTAFGGEAAKIATELQEKRVEWGREGREGEYPLKQGEELYVTEADVPKGFQRNPDGKVVATRPDPIKEQLAKSNSQEGRDLAADRELHKRNNANKRKP